MPTWLIRPEKLQCRNVPPPYCASSEFVSGTSIVIVFPEIAVIFRSQFWFFEPAVHGLSNRSIPISCIQLEGLGRVTRMSSPTASPDVLVTLKLFAPTGTYESLIV